MTNREYTTMLLIGVFIAGLSFGVITGVIIVALRYDIEIRTDQIELKEQVAEIIEDESIIEDIVQTLLFQVEQLKLERQELRELKITLSKGG